MSYFGKAFLAVVALLGLLGTNGGCAPGSVPPSSAAMEIDRGFRYDHRSFSLELSGVEVLGEEVKLAFMYTNRTDSSHYTRVEEAALVDNLGNRYKRTESRTQVKSLPGTPEKVWIAFGKVHPQASSVNLAMKWWAGTEECPRCFRDDRRCCPEITMRRIPLNWVAPSPPSADVRLQEGRIQAEVGFENNLGEPVVLYWLDLQGKETFYRELQPGESYRQGTFVTHSWRIRSKGTGEAKGTLVVDRSGQVVRITKEGLLVTSGGERKP